MATEPARRTPLCRSRLSTPLTPPSGLGNVKNTLFLSRGLGDTTLAWANASAATGYRVYRGTTADFMTGNPAPWGTPSSNSTTDAETPIIIFFYLVHATDGIGESAE